MKTIIILIVLFCVFPFWGESQNIVNNNNSYIHIPDNFIVTTNNFSNQNGAELSFGSGKLKVDNDFTNNGTINCGTGTIIFEGESTQNVSIIGTEIFYNIRVGSHTTLLLNSNNYLTALGNLNNNGFVNVNSTAAGDGSLIIEGDISGSGTYNVERYLKGGQWHLVTSPIIDGFSGVFENIWLRPYLEETNDFGEYIVPTDIPMPTGQGFSTWADVEQTRTFTGTVNHGEVSITLQLTGAAGITSGWNLIGNPFPSAIDWNASSGWTKTNVGGVIYVWDEDQYSTWDGSTGTNQGSRYIAMGQGFFVQATTSSSSIAMNNNVQLHNDIPFRNNQEPLDIIRIKVEGNNSSDESLVTLRPDANNIYDFNYDAAKLYGLPSAPQLYSKKQGSIMAINAITDISDIEGKKLYLETGAAGEYLLRFNHTLVENHTVIIKDLFTDNLIYPEQNYVFYSQPEYDAERFEFLIDISNISENIKNDISIWAFENILRVEICPNDKLENIELYSIRGQLLMQFMETEKDLNLLPAAVYVVKVKTDNNVSVEKIFIK